VQAVLAASIAQGEICALVDGANCFDPATAQRSGVVLEQLLWVQCGRQPDRALKVADLLLHTGGFGVVALDLCDVAASTLRRIPLSWWYRFRRAVENTPTILLISGNQPLAGSCSACVIEMEHRRTVWSGSARTPLLAGMELAAAPRKPLRVNSIHQGPMSLHAEMR
jgi:recombination protein RecA